MSPEFTQSETPSLRLSTEELLDATQLLLAAGRVDRDRAAELHDQIMSDLEMLLQFSVISDELNLRIASVLAELKLLAAR